MLRRSKRLQKKHFNEVMSTLSPDVQRLIRDRVRLEQLAQQRERRSRSGSRLSTLTSRSRRSRSRNSGHR